MVDIGVVQAEVGRGEQNLPVFVVDIAVIVAVPAGLHADLICVQDCVVLTAQRPFFPYVRGVAVGLFPQAVALVNIKEMPLPVFSQSDP